MAPRMPEYLDDPLIGVGWVIMEMIDWIETTDGGDEAVDEGVRIGLLLAPR